ncbi:hypothetical protein ISS08_01205 [Candidatus Pacearchaeota archaeon]|nr:hypothetical protein [Candidatus Pacearchaeota archaeon]
MKKEAKYLRALVNDDVLNAIPGIGLMNFLNKKRKGELRHPDRFFKARLAGHTTYANLPKIIIAPFIPTVYEFAQENLSKLYDLTKNIADLI